MSNPEVQTATPEKVKVDLSKIKKDPDSTGFPKPDIGKTIAVRCLTFHHAHPNLDARHSISAESAPGKGKVSIEFVPSLRHHRVEIQKPGVAGTRVLFIHEMHCASWEPL